MFAVVGVPSLATIGELNFLNIDGEAADLERKYNQFFDKEKFKKIRIFREGHKNLKLNLFLNLLSNVKKFGRFFKILRPSQNI